MPTGRTPVADAVPAPRAAPRPPGTPPATRAPDEAARWVVRMEGWGLLAARAAALFNVGVALVTSGRSEHRYAAALALAAVLLVESAALGALTLRRGRLPQWTGWADLAVGCGALVLNATAVKGQYVHSWGFFAYPYTLAGSCALGLLLRGPWRIGAACAGLAVTYALCDRLSDGQPWQNIVPNAASYLGIAPVVALVAHQLRRMGTQLDASRAEALELAARAAVLQERTRQSRLLHDRVLQTMETLGGGGWVPDPWMRDQVRAEAAWLRWLVERGPESVPPPWGDGSGGPAGDGPQLPGTTDLFSALHALARERSRHGLAVAVNVPAGPGNASPAVPADIAAALLAACNEALTNVAKHAGTDRASLWAAVEGGDVVVGVVDQGRGFDPADRPEGIGLTRSIRGRLAEIGGTVRLDTAEGEGTSVELRAPLP